MNITIVGGGFGGIKAALELAKYKKNKITLISDKHDFQYYPALYSSATGHSHLESWVPLGQIFTGISNIHVSIDTVVSIDHDAKVLRGKSGVSYPYQACILALGTVTTYFGIKGLDTYAYGIKSADEIKRLKQHLFEDIVIDKDMDKHYVIVGAGPTGVELAAAFGSYLNRLCERYGARNSRPKIDLVEAAPRVLPRMSPQASKKVTERLKRLGVSVHVNKKVEAETKDAIIVSGKKIESETVIWTSGVANHPFYRQFPAFKTAPNGRIVVDEYMQALPDVYVIGDNAATPYTGLAQTALHDGIFVAKNLIRKAKKRPMRKYKAVRPPVVVPVGENWAVLEWHWLRLYGWPAALLRRAADFIGYNDMMPLGQALGVWRATMVMEDDYFTPRPPKKNVPSKKS